MLGEGGTPLSRLLAAIREFQARDDRRVDLKGLRAGIDALEAEFAGEALEVKRSGDHRIGGNISAATWISQICGMSVPSAKDRLCVGEQLESLPMIAEALSRGEISYQSASVICHQLPGRRAVARLCPQAHDQGPELDRRSLSLCG